MSIVNAATQIFAYDLVVPSATTRHNKLGVFHIPPTFCYHDCILSTYFNSLLGLRGLFRSTRCDSSIQLGKMDTEKK